MTMTAERRELLMRLREGDVVRLNGKLRVIRRATDPRKSRFDYPPKRCFTFAILRCSWTGKPYTRYTTSDLGNPKWQLELVMRNYQPKTEVERKLAEAIDWRGPRWPAMPDLTCCDIKGIS